ncbi:MAG: hypothetical protein R3C19_18150 [Planctomycetaceae bacterium]
MSGTAQYFVFASLAIVALIAVLCILDMIFSFPFGGQMVLDIVFLIAGAMTAYMAMDCLRKK